MNRCLHTYASLKFIGLPGIYIDLYSPRAIKHHLIPGRDTAPPQKWFLIEALLHACVLPSLCFLPNAMLILFLASHAKSSCRMPRKEDITWSESIAAYISPTTPPLMASLMNDIKAGGCMTIASSTLRWVLNAPVNQATFQSFLRLHIQYAMLRQPSAELMITSSGEIFTLVLLRIWRHVRRHLWYDFITLPNRRARLAIDERFIEIWGRNIRWITLRMILRHQVWFRRKELPLPATRWERDESNIQLLITGLGLLVKKVSLSYKFPRRIMNNERSRALQSHTPTISASFTFPQQMPSNFIGIIY